MLTLDIIGLDMVLMVLMILMLVKVNNYIVRSYRDVIVVTNIVTRRTSKA